MMESRTEFHVVILAGGRGERFQAKNPKQFHQLNEKPVVFHTVEKVARMKCVRNIVVVAPEDEELIAKMRDVLKPLTGYSPLITITAGGKTRNRSAFEGLKFLRDLLRKSGQGWEDEIVVVNDAVRPFATGEDINKIADFAKDHKAAGGIIPIRGSVVEVDSNDMLLNCCDRSTHWSSESPQAFKLGFVYECYEKSSDEDLDCFTDCMQFTSKYGKESAKFIRANPRNMKITYQADLYAARYMLKENEIMLCIWPGFNGCSKSELNGQNIIVSNLEDAVEKLNDNISMILYVIKDEMNRFPHEADKLLQVLRHEKNRQPYCVGKLQSVLFVLSERSMEKDQENFRKMFVNVSKQLAERGFASHAIICNDYTTVVDRIRRALPSLSDVDILPSGQILYF